MIIPDIYCKHLDMINRSGFLQRAETARQLLAANSNVEQRNRCLYDALHVLEGSWRDSEEVRGWSFIDLPGLDALRNRPLPEEIDGTLRAKVEKRVAEALEDTPASFEELQEKAEEFQGKFMARQDKRPGEMDAEDYRRWFYQYAPYLTLDLPKSTDKAIMDDAAKEAGRRLEWFEKFIPKKNNDIRAHIHWMGWCRIVDWRSEIA
ncbi:MAG: hypothetical protein BECKG1743F_GA0114225_100121 [Candidatus Kentron sp. G]|nr:MAG: hypothetical protein BECKG1743F_GA0114225_100121 [Candidatus Kentron sp. G]VFM95660.1 MAG: hypothetical protein BECKG1743E_GA0114224_100111 [Candidatus Kentron sp. G]